MSEAVFAAILARLDDTGATYEVIEHAPVETAEQAAAVRGTPLEMGAKSILFKTDDVFRILAFSAGRALRSRDLRRRLGVRRTRFATPRELSDLVGVLPGAVPPFGRPILPFDLFADPSLFERDRLVFTAGLRTRSIAIAPDDYRRAAAPEVFPFTRAAHAPPDADPQPPPRND